MPDLDPKGNGNMRCGVYISGVGLKYTYGEDSFQALGLAYVYIKIKIQTLLNDGIDLYHDRQMKSPYDAALIILNDYSAFMEK